MSSATRREACNACNVTPGVEVRRRLREFGRQFTPEMIQGTHQLYVASQRARDYLAPAIERDITYGARPRHRLDVHYLGAVGVATRPVFVLCTVVDTPPATSRWETFLSTTMSVAGPSGMAWSA